MRGLLESGYFWFVLTVVSFLASVGLTVWFWGWLHPSAPTTVSNSETLRNVGLLIGGLLAFVFAGWRAWVAERQANAARLQAQTELRQADTAQQSLLNERHQRGAEMLGSNVPAVRMGGIYALKRLAEEHPDLYHIQIMSLLCAFARVPTSDGGDKIRFQTQDGQEAETATVRPDVQEVMQAIGSRGAVGISLERSEQEFHLYLRNAVLRGVQLRKANLSRAWLTKADLSGAILPYADLSSARLRRASLAGAGLRHADLSGALLWGADLSGAILQRANLSGADMCGRDARSPRYGEPVHGLTQAQLDTACADPGDPPMLDGVVDAETGEPLVWRGNPVNDGS